MNTAQTALYYLTFNRFPSEKAHGVFLAKSCEAFSRAGMETTLVVPRRLGRLREDPYAYYGVEKKFRVKTLPTIDLFAVPILPGLMYRISDAVFGSICVLYLLFAAQRDAIIYSNDAVLLLFASMRFRNTYYEIHDYPEKNRALYNRLFARLRGVIVQTKWKRQKIAEDFGVAPERILYEPNAVDLEFFDVEVSRTEARNKLQLPQDAKLIVYTGHLFSWKGVDTLARAAAYLPPDMQVVFVGGLAHDVARFRTTYGGQENMRIIGHRPFQEMPQWQKAADVLVLPNTGREDISVRYTSPMKLFEYMASKRPIVASDIPSLREILNEQNAALVSPDEPEQLAHEIRALLADEKRARQLAEQAFADVKAHSWQKRAERISAFLTQYS